MRTSSILLATLWLASCGGSAPDETVASTETSSAGGETAEAPLPTLPKPWAEMTQQERGAFMHDSVAPATQRMFQEYDAERYADFGCGTCHGSDMVAREFAMPNPGLLPLYPTGSEEQRAAVEAHPRMVRFMYNHLLPTVRDMLELPEFDAETEQGFSCFSCHTHGTPAAADEPTETNEGDETAPETE